MPQNPNENQDQQTSSTSSEKNSWSAPAGSGAKSFVRIDHDDLHPERVERLGQYLSSTTQGDMSNPDVRGGQKNHFPISPPDEDTPLHFQQGLESTLSEATTYFNELKHASAFEAGVAIEADGTYGSGHDLLGQEKGRSIVEKHISTKSADNNSRWFGIGVQKFEPKSGSNRHQVDRDGDNLDKNLADDADPSPGSRFKNYKHKTGQTNKGSMATDVDFWDEYFKRLSYVGAKITLGAQGIANPEDWPVKSEGVGAGANPALRDLKGGYAKVDLELIEAGKTFLDGARGITSDQIEDIKDDFKKTSGPSYTGDSYGQMHSWKDPFESTGFPLVENSGLKVAAQLLEIWAMSVLKTFVTTGLLQIASYLTSVIMQNTDVEKGTRDYLGVNWNTNYYPESPLIQPGTAFFKGYSGFNHPATNLGEKASAGMNHGSATVRNDVAGFFTTVLAQQAGPPVNTAFRSLDKLLNFTTHILRDLNIYMPRHIISQMAQEIGYQDDSKELPALLKNITKLVDIGTAYTRAMTIGMSTMTVHIIADDYGKSLGFYKTLFREVVRSKAVYSEQRQAGNKWDGMLTYFGKDDKIMRFVNYLAQIGDMSVGAGEAGNMAFSENKVALDQIGNHPSLRTVAGRKRGKGTQSRLSLTDTPSLFLLPKSVNITRLQLQALGLEEAGSGDFAALNGANNLFVGGDKEQEGIKQKFQQNAGGRFDPVQVQRIEDQLEAEHLPFYIQDLRTNEIISFHAFLTSLSDSYSAEWSAQKGFGRIEAAQIYGGGSRSISVNFLVVPMNAEDFDDMYYKINKLTTLVYPQWSQGTMMQNGESTYVQPFSQVPTASPLCRIRVGDLFTSNYSDVAMARMMGANTTNFKYVEPAGVAGSDLIADEKSLSIEEQLKQDRFPAMTVIKEVAELNGWNSTQLAEIKEDYSTQPTEYTVSWDSETETLEVIFPGLISIPGKKISLAGKDKNYFLKYSKVKVDPGPFNPYASSSGGISSLFDRQKNPIMKAFNSTMGRGIAVAITGIGLDWKLNSVPWNMEPGHKAPRMCEISLSLIPIHDITPGLDHEGVNRAPIYKVGDSSKSLTGDVWHNKKVYNELITGIEGARDAYLRAEEKDRNG